MAGSLKSGRCSGDRWWADYVMRLSCPAATRVKEEARGSDAPCGMPSPLRPTLLARDWLPAALIGHIRWGLEF